MEQKKINQYLEKIDDETKRIARQYYLDGDVKKVFEIKPGVFRAMIEHHSLESKVTISFQNEEIMANCECQSYRVSGHCTHIAAVLYYLLEHPMMPSSMFVDQSIDSLVYDCDEKDAKAYLNYELTHSQYKRELIKFLFFQIKDKSLRQDDYQYLFDYLYTFSESGDRLKVISRLYDAMFERFRLKLLDAQYEEAMLIVKEMILNESDIETDVENSLAYFEEHLSRNVMHIKSCIKYLSIYMGEFSDLEKKEYREVLLALTKKAKIYVGCCTEIKHLVFEHFSATDNELADAMKEIYLLLAKCSDVCRQTTVELIFKLIDTRDRDYPFFKAIYSELLFNRAYNPSNLNLDLLEEIKSLNEDSYASDINKLARFINEKNSQKQLLDVLVNDENWRELGQSAMYAPNLRYLYIYSTNIKAACGHDFTSLVFTALCEYLARFPSGMDTAFITYIYMDEGEQYFILLLDMIKDKISFDRARDLVERYRDIKYRVISKDLPVNQRLEQYYLANYKNLG